MKSLPGPVTVGIVGSGYASYLHCKGYERVGKIPVRLKTVCDVDEAKATETANKFSIEQTCKDYRKCWRTRRSTSSTYVLLHFTCTDHQRCIAGE